MSARSVLFVAPFVASLFVFASLLLYCMFAVDLTVGLVQVRTGGCGCWTQVRGAR